MTEITVIETRFEDIEVHPKTLKFNNHEKTEFFRKFDKAVKSLITEIIYNKELDEKKGFEEYLYRIKDLSERVQNNISREKGDVEFKNIKLVGEIQDVIGLKDFKKELLVKYFELQAGLIGIEEYKSIHTKSQKSPSGNKKIVWKKKVNKLVEFYMWQEKEGIIGKDSDENNLKQFLLNNFLDVEGKPLSKSTLDTYFDPNKEDEKLEKIKDKVRPPKDLLKDS